MLIVLTAIVGFFTLPPEEAWFTYSLAAAYLWSVLFGYIARHELVSSQLNISSVVVGVFLPMLLVGAYSSGLMDGKQDIVRNDPAYGLISKGKAEQQHTVILLRTLEKVR